MELINEQHTLEASDLQALGFMPQDFGPAGFVTRISSHTPATMGKVFRLGEGGQILKDQPDNLLEGHAELVPFESAEEFRELLLNVRDHQALCPQIPTEGRWLLPLTTRARLTSERAAAGWGTRTKGHFEARAGRGVLVLDYDPPPHEALSKVELWDALLDAVPGLADGSAIWWTSSSSHIFNGEAEVSGLRGQRIYLLVEDVSDSLRALKVLNARAWLKGFGRIEVSAAGSLLTRGLADEAMSSGARLDYIGGAVCEAPLSQRRPPPEILADGGWLDTRKAIPDLAPAEGKEFMRRVNDAMREAEPTARKIREQRARLKAADLSARLVEQGVPAEESSSRARAAAAAMQGGQLPADFVITLEAGESVTVGELLADPARYNGRACLDPEEPEYRGGKVVGHLNLGDGEPNIYSHAHGGKRYLLVREASHVFQRAAVAGIEVGGLLTIGERGKKMNMTPSHIAEALAPVFAGEYAFDAETSVWHHWTGAHWEADRKGSVLQRRMHAVMEVGFSPLGFGPASLTNAISMMETGGRLNLRLADENFLPFKNGMLDLRTKEFRPSSPDHAADWSLPYDYDPGADCPNIKAWLMQALRCDEETVEYVRAVFAAILTGRFDLQTFFYLKGRAGTGKGSLLRLATAMMGEHNVHVTTLKALEGDQFETAACYGKRLVVVTDASRHGGSVEVLKNLTGGDRVRLRRMQREATSFLYRGTVLLASNEDLVSTDATSALDRRRAVVKFDRTATAEEKADWSRRGGEEAVLHTEIPGLVNWALGLSREEVTHAIRNPPAAVKEANAEAHQSNNHVSRWLQACCEPDAEHVAAWGKSEEFKAMNGAVRYRGAGADLYPSFLGFARGEGVHEIGLQRFKGLVIETCETLGWPVTQRNASGKPSRTRDGRYGVRGIRVAATAD